MTHEDALCFNVIHVCGEIAVLLLMNGLNYERYIR
jgi:hypothetical protein